MGMALIMIFTIFAIVVPMSAGQSSSSVTRGSYGGYNILITDTANNRVIEVDDAGNIAWQYTALYYPYDAERLENGNTLITDTGNGRIIEVDPTGKIVWQRAGLLYPFDAERLDNGNTLITHGLWFGASVIEVNSGGSIVWQKLGLNMPNDVERLDNGNTLIVESGRVIEINPSGSIVWQYLTRSAYDAERLDNGNTLITDWSYCHVIEVDSSGKIIWQWHPGFPLYIHMPVDVEALDDGHTLITMASSMMFKNIIEIDSSQNLVWQHSSGLRSPNDAEIVDSAITADVRVEPQSLNLDSKGNYVNVKVEGFPDNPEYSPLDVDGDTIKVAGVDADSRFGTWDEDRYIGKADRLAVEDAIGAPGEEVEVTVTGKLVDGTAFEGIAIIKVV